MSQLSASSTIWTQTLLDALYGRLRGGYTDSHVKAAIDDVMERGMPLRRLLLMVEQEVGIDAAARVARVVAMATPSPSRQRGRARVRSRPTLGRSPRHVSRWRRWLVWLKVKLG